MRVDTTVVETNIHYPTDSTLLGDGVRVLTRTMKRITRDRRRGRNQAARPQPEREAAAARDRADSARQGPAQSGAIAAAVPPTARYDEPGGGAGEAVLAGDSRRREAVRGRAAADRAGRPAAELDRMVPRVRQVMQQTRARIFGGDTHIEGKLVSVFEPSTEVIRKGKAGKPTEFGKMVKLQEAENQIIIDYEVYDRRPNDSELLIPAIAAHQAKLGRVPRLVAADAGFYSARNEAAGESDGRQARVHSQSLDARAPSASASKRSAGSATARNGAPDAKGASAWSNGDTAQSLPIQGRRRHAALGRPRRHRRQSRQHRSGDEPTGGR